MELANLSSNWKQLQKTLKPSNKSSNGTDRSPQQPSSKRKRSDFDSRRPSQPTPRKKPRRDDGTSKTQPNKPSRYNKMNAATTTNTPTSSPTCASTATLPADAALENAGLSPSASPGKYIALDCEMVGIGPQLPPNRPGASMLARASLVNYHGTQLYDSYVLPTEPVTDWRTAISGVSPAHMKHARPFKEVQSAVARLLKDRVLVGHSVRHDLEVLGLAHPRRDVRDTARYPAYRRLAGGGSPRLRDLVAGLLGVRIQDGSHSSVVDARATMMLFRRDKEGFERENVKRWGVDRRERMVAVEKGGGAGAGAGGGEKDGEEGQERGEVEEEEGEGVERNGNEGDAKKKAKKPKKKKKKK